MSAGTCTVRSASTASASTASLRRFLPLRVVAAAVLFCAFAADFPAQAQEGASATAFTLKGVMGTVKVYSARDRSKANIDDVGTWPAARVGMALREKDYIATLDESEARIEAPDGSEVRLRENTNVSIATVKATGGATNAKLRVNDGSVVANVKKIVGAKSSFELETPTALAAIRGTTVELDSKKGAGTTVKTFDGKVQVAPASSKEFADVGHYEMTEVAGGQKKAKARAVPSFYKQKTTKLLSEEETAALTGFTRVILTLSELDDIKNRFEGDGIPCGVGLGESDDEMTARKISSDAARTELAKGMSTQVQRISESYAQNIGGEAKKIWEEGVRQITDVSVRGSSVHTTITQFNAEKKAFKVYSLMVLDPKRLKSLFGNTASKVEEEFELRVKKDDMMSKMDSAIKAYDTRYNDR